MRAVIQSPTCSPFLSARSWLMIATDRSPAAICRPSVSVSVPVVNRSSVSVPHTPDTVVLRCSSSATETVPGNKDRLSKRTRLSYPALEYLTPGTPLIAAMSSGVSCTVEYTRKLVLVFPVSSSNSLSLMISLTT